jgi:NTP pyrophosphatase (non-canonical NTP hydrolase)
MRYELGDILWFVAIIAKELGMTLESVAECNLDKLKDKALRNKLRGLKVGS